MASVRRKIISTDKAPIPKVPLSRSNGQCSLHFRAIGIGSDGKIVEGFEAQARLTMDNIGHILKAAGASFKNVSKMTVFLQDISQFQEMNKVYADYFTKPYPARTAFQVAQLPMPGGLIEIDAIAVLGNVVDE